MSVIEDITFMDVEKRKYPGKHYVYVITVKWNNETTNLIYRRFSQFFSLQCILLDKFPEEAGCSKSQDRILPALPGKIIFGRSHVREVAVKRMKLLEGYCRRLIQLPLKISRSDDVLGFFKYSNFEPKPEFLNACGLQQPLPISVISHPQPAEKFQVVAAYKRDDAAGINVEIGQIVEVVEKMETGWWLVKIEDKYAWVPANYLTPFSAIDSTSKTVAGVIDGGLYAATNSYVAKNLDELTFQRGDVVEILERNDYGWWLARFDGKEGLVPGIYFIRLENSSTSCSASEVELACFGLQEPLAEQLARIWDEKPNSFDVDSELGQIDTSSSSLTDSSSLNKKYTTLAAFFDESPNCISFIGGQEVEVLQADLSGWWYINVNGKKGWAPSTYLEALQAEDSDQEKKSDNAISRQDSENELPVVKPDLIVSLQRLEIKHSNDPKPVNIASKIQKDVVEERKAECTNENHLPTIAEISPNGMEELSVASKIKLFEEHQQRSGTTTVVYRNGCEN